MSNISKPHDSLFKDFLSDIEIARRFLEVHLPKELQQQCDLSTLELQNGSFIGNELKQRFTDILYRVKCRKKDAYLYMLIEHQSGAERMLPLRVCRYEIDVMQGHLDKGHDELPEVTSLIFYRGRTSPYPYSADILDHFENPGQKRRGDFPKIPIIIDVSAIPDEEIRTHGSIALLETLQKYIKVKDLCDFAQDIVTGLDHHPLSKDRKKKVFHYMLSEGNCADFDQFYKMIYQYSSKTGEDMMSVAQQLKQEGWEEGQREGQQKGVQQEKFAVLNKMLEEGLPAELITKITGLPQDDFHALMKNLKLKPKLTLY